MKKRGKNLFKKDLKPNYNLRKLTFSLSLLVVVLGSVLVYRGIEAGELQTVFFPDEQMVAKVAQSTANPKIEVNPNNSAAAKKTTSVDTKQNSSLNNANTSQNSENSNKNSDNDYFLNYEMERDSTRAQQVEMLNGLINNQNVDAETKKIAQKRLLNITDALDEELLLTNLLNAKYDTQTAVFVQEKEVNVIIKKAPGTLKQTEIEKIAQIVNSQTGVGFENVVIVLKN